MVFGPMDVKACWKVRIIDTQNMERQKVDSIYVASAEEAYVYKTKQNKIVDLWHTWLGHISYHKFKVTMNKSVLKGLLWLNIRSDVVYAYHMKSLIQSEVAIGACSLSCIWMGKTTIAQWDAKLVTFIDYYSKYIWVYFMKENQEL